MVSIATGVADGGNEVPAMVLDELVPSVAAARGGAATSAKGSENVRSTWASRAYRSDRGKLRKERLAPAPPTLERKFEDVSIPRAAAPSVPCAAPVGSSIGAARSSPQSKLDDIGVLAQRLSSGRTVANLTAAMETRLFSDTSVSEPLPLAPAKGLFASWHGIVQL